MMHETPFLPTPPSAGVLRRCDSCRRWLALELQHTVPDKIVGELRIYRCKYCGAEFEFAESLPDGVMSSRQAISD